MRTGHCCAAVSRNGPLSLSRESKANFWVTPEVKAGGKAPTPHKSDLPVAGKRRASSESEYLAGDPHCVPAGWSER
ncbi:MAG: hypothetical protein OHK005_03580 [Candidatus Methylacidiphilales bacterium]